MKQTPVEDAEKAQRARWALASLSLSMLMPSLDTSIANVGLPTLAQAFGASFQSVQWIVLAYLLAITILIVSVGRLGDMVGRRRLLLAGIGVFTAASLVCGLAPSLWILVAARAVQGIGAATMMALTIALIGETVPSSRLGSAMGLLGTMSAIGTSLGPSLGGVLIAALGWRTIFLVNVPLGIANLLLVRRFVAASPRSTRGASRFDAIGTTLFGVTLAAYALAVTRGHLDIALLAVATISAAAFVRVEKTAASPLVPITMFRDRALSASLVMNALVSTVMMATLVVGPFYLSRALGLETALVGIVMSIGPLVSATAGIPAGRIVDRFSARRATIIGLGGMTLGLSALSAGANMHALIAYIAPVVVITASYALFQAANNTAVMTGVEHDRRGVVAGMLSLSRNLGLITGASAMGAVFAFASSAPDVTTATPAAVATGMRITFAVAAVLIAAALAIGATIRTRREYSLVTSDAPDLHLAADARAARR